MTSGFDYTKNAANFGVSENGCLSHGERPFVEEMLAIATYVQLFGAQPFACLYQNADASRRWWDKFKNDVFVRGSDFVRRS
jgi:hypothetical protein